MRIQTSIKELCFIENSCGFFIGFPPASRKNHEVGNTRSMLNIANT